MKIIVTRHQALVDFMKELRIIGENEEIQILAHIDNPSQIKGLHVFGVLSLSLAHHAKRVTEIFLTIPSELRGKELTLEQLRVYYTGAYTYEEYYEYSTLD